MANKKYITPRGIAKYPKTDKGYKWNDSANRNTPDPDGEYMLDLIVSEEGLAPIKRVVETFLKEGNLKAKNKPWQKNKDKDGTELDTYIVKFKQYAKNQDGSKRVLPHFDAKARKLPEDFMLTNGSTVAVQYHPFYYKAQGGGVKLYLDSIQVIDYVQWEGSSPFDAVDDGFTYEGETDNSDYDEDTINEDEDDSVPY